MKSLTSITAGQRPAGLTSKYQHLPERQDKNIKMSYTKLLYHIVFRTKNSKKSISEQHENELYAYILGMINNKKSKLYRIGGMPDHIHLLVDIHPTYAVSDFMRELKEYSSKWLLCNPNFPFFDGWAISFAAFSYNLREKDIIINYIKNQKKHHKKASFEEEYRKFLIENGIAIDERYFLKE